MFWLGRQKKLDPDDLFHVDSGLKTARYSSLMAEAWDKGLMFAFVVMWKL